MKASIITILSLMSLIFSNNTFSNTDLDVFMKDTPESSLTIKYDDLDILLKASVLSVGRSTRAKAKASKASIGTRMKVRINKLTALEGNRFYFEEFNKDSNQQLLEGIKKSLESLPLEVPLGQFNKKEQLAYWLNLYNVTVLTELVRMYPIKKLDDEFEDDTTIFSKKLLNVSGVELSLNDIQYKILFQHYDADPLIIYGLYQGIVGGPSIRKGAFTSNNVDFNLKANAKEFINSNRGTYSEGKKTFRVSSLYERNEVYFPDFQNDLKKHLKSYIYGTMGRYLDYSSKLKPNINDWNISDLYGSSTSYGMSSATNSAALMDSASIVSAGGGKFDGNTSSPNLGLASEVFSDRSLSFGRFSAEQAELLKSIDTIRLKNTGEVTIKDINQ